ncbi:MAG TPA: CBS domain-containing protein, partial [Acidobacteriota bacterium]|nr:CBS domain-containing protein [Acidobacteriota bacterium]
MNRCRTCTYFTSQLADLSIGGAGPLKDWSIVIIRTKKGEDFFNIAVKQGVITTKKIETEPEALAHLLQLATYKRDSALQEIEAMRKAGVPVPTGMEVFYQISASETSTLDELKVREIMTRKVTYVPPTMTVNELLDKIAKHHHIGFPVVDESNKTVGIVTLQDAMAVDKEKRNSVSIGEIATKNLVVAFPDDSVGEAFKKMSEHHIGRLLVVDENDTSLLLGILTRSDVMQAFRKISR